MNIFPNKTNPYYIVANRFNPKSAGVTVMHLLCHHLNTSGYLAFLVSLNCDAELITNPRLATPVLNEALAQAHLSEGLNPIAVYPEIIHGNPLKCTCVVRYVLNYPGLLGGDLTYDSQELIYGHTKELSLAGGGPEENILFMPVADRNFFHPPSEADNKKRKGSCFYARKHLMLGGALIDVTKDSIEIRNGLEAQSKFQVAELFRNCEYFYCYENTALIYEAMLCGCPVILIESKDFNKKENIALTLFEGQGYAWLSEPENHEHTKESVSKFISIYDGWCDKYWNQLAHFIKDTQSRAAITTPPKSIGFANNFLSYSKLLIFNKMSFREQLNEVRQYSGKKIKRLFS